ncbi:PREDICTED: leucine-rich repeat-containing protein 4B-like [Branchiostoma belcheri]|uniref:Leucine-rich repeat-containing protein 4B-like n=1 Tax=Branchiostoma belcheri TaxID=7741 RepID=A0A6P4ZPM5_BRABE|nr:PREDICTED: leucine-rich repeat-containing protein 4B-like [Branchiostoma belcheri]
MVAALGSLCTAEMLLTVLVMLMTSRTVTSTRSCPRVCRCSGSHFYVDCGARGLTKVPKFVPYVVQSFTLPNNNITRLGVDQFVSLQQLEILQLSDNIISEIDDGAFNNLTKLETLELHNNRLTSVPSAAFASLVGLRELWIGRNPIISLQANAFSPLQRLRFLDLGELSRLQTVSKDAFSGLRRLVYLNMAMSNLKSVPYLQYLTSLEGLDLSGNYIEVLRTKDFLNLTTLRRLTIVFSSVKTIQPNAFNDLSRVQELDLSYNNLTVLPPELTYSLYSLRRIDLSENPWNCTCELSWLVGWLSVHVQNRTVDWIGTCETPVSLQGTALVNLQQYMLQCPDENGTNPRLEVPEGDSASLFCNNGKAREVSWITPNGTVMSHGSYKVRVRVFNDGSLNITSVTMSDSGLYRCMSDKMSSNKWSGTILKVIPRKPKSAGSTDFPVVGTPVESFTISTNSCEEVTEMDVGGQNKSYDDNMTASPPVNVAPGGNGETDDNADYEPGKEPVDHKKYIISSIVSLISFGFLMWTVCFLCARCTRARRRRKKKKAAARGQCSESNSCNSISNHHMPAVVDVYGVGTSGDSPCKGNCATLKTFGEKGGVKIDIHEIPSVKSISPSKSKSTLTTFVDSSMETIV